MFYQHLSKIQEASSKNVDSQCSLSFEIKLLFFGDFHYLNWCFEDVGDLKTLPWNRVTTLLFDVVSVTSDTLPDLTQINRGEYTVKQSTFR